MSGNVSTEELKALVKLYLYYLYTKDKNLLEVDTNDANATSVALANYSGLEVNDHDNPWKILPGSDDTLFANVVVFDNYKNILNGLSGRPNTNQLLYIREGQGWLINKIAKQYDVLLSKTQKTYLTSFSILANFINHAHDEPFKAKIHDLETPLRYWKLIRSLVAGGTTLAIIAGMAVISVYPNDTVIHDLYYFKIQITFLICLGFLLDYFMMGYLGKKVHDKLVY